MADAELKEIQTVFSPFQAIRSEREERRCFLRGTRTGYTLIEVMIAVTLTLILMYALAAIFGRVTSIMTQAQDVLSMTNNLRAAKDRLREDLENLTVPRLKAPTSRYGFFSYSEGLGNAFEWLLYDEIGSKLINPRRFTTYGNFDRRTPSMDNTIGDTDDILSFTVRAPAGKWFRGRCFKELPETHTSDYDASIDDNIEMIESEYAEVIWFLRGTTLYRRVLLIVPDELLERRLRSLNRYLRYQYGNLYNHYGTSGKWHPLLPSAGYGFYRFFDISIHKPLFQGDRKSLSWTDLDGNSYSADSRVVANTLSDLSNRRNRFGYWYSLVMPPGETSVKEDPYFDTVLHGNLLGWYWLRMPTLQESALWTGTPDLGDLPTGKFFCAGSTHGHEWDDPLRSQSSRESLSYWLGEIFLGLRYLGPNPADGDYTSASLPESYFIDQWQAPNPWIQQEPFSGQLDLAGINGEIKTFNSDVLLTNVLCFDVKVWNEKSSSFVNLGDQLFDDEGEYEPDPADFRSSGNYGLRAVRRAFRLRDPATRKPDESDQQYRPVMPAVFDTWTEDYQKEFLSGTWPLVIDGNKVDVFGASSRPGFTVGDIPLDGNVTVSDLPDCPPPYEAEIKVIQVELRAFDPVSRTIKNATVEINIP